MKTKIFKLAITTFFLMFAASSFSQNWVWGRQIGGAYTDLGGARIDANNNIYCSGIFNYECYFEHDTLRAEGSNDIFLAKFDPDGNELWAKRIGGSNPNKVDEWFGSIIIDKCNECFYFSGTFYGMLTIDGHTVYSSGGLDIFIAKFDLSGNCIWLKKSGSMGDDDAGLFCLDANGNIYYTGRLKYNSTFGTINLSKGSFLSKLSPDGTIIWARDEIKDGWACALKIKNNNLLMSGMTINDTIMIDTTMLISTHEIDGFIACLDTLGNCKRAKRFKGHFQNAACSFETGANNSIYLTGFFTDTLHIDTTTLTINNGSGDMFFCKFDSVFNLKWITQSHSTNSYGSNAGDVVKDNEGKFCVAGYFGGNASFGAFNVSSPTKDMFVARYDENGNCLGIIHFGEAEADNFACGGLNINSDGDLIIAGNFANTVNIGGTTLTSYGSTDIFIAKTRAINGIEEKKQPANNGLLIYANPSTGKCNINVPDEFLNEKNLTLYIFDNTGKLIQHAELEMTEDKIKLNLEQEAKGIYNVNLSNGKKAYSGKIVFE